MTRRERLIEAALGIGATFGFFTFLTFVAALGETP